MEFHFPFKIFKMAAFWGWERAERPKILWFCFLEEFIKIYLEFFKKNRFGFTLSLRWLNISHQRQ